MDSRKKLNEAQEQELCQRYEAGEGTTLLSRAFGVSVATARKTLINREVKIRPKKKPLTAAQRLEIATRYERGEGCRVLGAAYGIAHQNVPAIVKSAGLSMRAKEGEELGADQRAEVCRLYKQGESSLALAKKFEVSKVSVLRLLEKRGVETRTPSEASNLRKRKYQCDHSFFDEINTEEKAYWLGFIAADGNVYRRTLSVGLSDSDEAHLYRLKSALGSDHPVRRYPRRGRIINGRTCADTVCSMLAINSQQMTNGLRCLGVIENKSLIATWAKIPANLERHYLRGLVDGDGCFTGKGQAAFVFCGSRKVVCSAKSLLREMCGLNETKTIEKGEFHTIQFGGNKQVARIAEYLYEGATIFLPRKYGKVKHLMGRY